MSFIKTKTFKLASYSKGDANSPKLALILPGRLDTKDYPHMRSHVDFLASLGYFAVSFDPPGTWDSPGGIEMYTMTNYLKAINELIEHFGNKPTLLMGHSRGGSMAILAGVTNPHVTHLIAVMSNTSPSIPGKDTAMEPGDVQIEYRDVPLSGAKKKKFDLPYSYFEDASKYNLLGNLRVSTKPKLFFLGTHDGLAKPEVVKKAFDEAAEPKTLYELNSDHNYRWHPELIEEVNRVIGEFINQYKS